MRRRIVSLAALSLVATLVACDRAPLYATTLQAARTRLIGTTIPDMAFGKAAHSDPGEASADGVQWAVESGSADGTLPGGGPADFILRARLTQSADGLRLATEMAPPPGTDPAKFQALLDQHPAIVRMFDRVIVEQVDSALSARPFSFADIRGDMALAMAAELPNIRQYLDEQARAVDERDRDTLHRAYNEAEQDPPGYGVRR